MNAKPLYGGLGKGNGLALTLVPEEPVIAFHKFRFEEHHNWIYLHKNMRVYANVDMQDNEGMGIRMQSLPSDTVSLQNMDVELRRIRLEEYAADYRIAFGRSPLYTDGEIVGIICGSKYR